VEPEEVVMLGKDTVNRTPAVVEPAVFRTIIDSIPAAVFVFQGERMCYVNSSAQSITGYSRAELLEMPFWTVVHPDFQGLVRQRGLDRQTGDAVPADYEVKVVRKDGESIWVKFRASIIDLDGQSAVLGLAEDITERKLAEDRLQQGQRVFELLADYNQMAAGLSADAVIQKTLAFLHDTFSSHESSIAIIEADQNSFFLQSSSHQAQLELDQGRLIPLHATILAEVIKSHQPRYRPDIEGEHSMYAIDTQLLKNGFRSDFLVPLWVEDTCLGTLNMCRSEIDAFSEHERRLVPLLASRLAQALHNASLLHALRESEEQYRTLVEDSPDMIHSLDSEGRITSANTAEMETMGYSTEEYIGKSALDIVHPDYLEATKSALAFVLAGQTINKYETALVTKEGKQIYVEVSATPKTVDGKVVATRAIIRDITERIQNDESLKQNEHRQLVSNKLGLDALAGLQLDELFQKTTELIAETLGVEYCKILELQPDGKAMLLRAGVGWKAGLVGHAVVGTELESQAGYTLKSSHPVIVKDLSAEPRFSGPPLLREHGVISGISVIIGNMDQPWGVLGAHTKTHRDFSEHDINFIQTLANTLALAIERKQTEQALYESEKKYRGMVMNLMEGFYRVTLDGKLQNYNVEFIEILGLDPIKDYTGIELPIFWQNSEDRKDYARAIKTHGFIKNYVVHAKKLNGEKIILQVSARLIKGENSDPLLIEGSFLDITEHKEAEAQVRKLSNAVTHAGGSIIITNRAGIIEYVNPAFTKITGYSTEDAMGQTLRILNSGNQNTAFYERMWQAITRGDIWHGKVIDKRKDGSFFPAMLTIAPIVDGQGVITHFVGSHADITELEDMQAQFHQAQKMESLGTLVGGIAHNFNNTLAGMTGHLYLAKKQAQDIPAVVEKLAIVEKLSFRAADMIQQLLTFARRGRVSMKRLPLSPFIKETLKFLRSSVPESIKVEENLCEDDLPVSGDATQIHQILMNLINNACDAVEGVHMPVVTFGLEAFHVDDAFIENHPGSQVGDYAHLSVKDNGCGIAADLLERIFEPFFTTKAVGRGTGLGLAMIFGAVKTHQGFVTVDSMQGRGSTFHIYLPLLAQEDIAAVSVPGQGESPGQGELILLVDDEVQIIETGKEVLKSLGYRVITATNGRQAVAMFNEHFGEVRLCILDVVMPAMSGVKVAQSIRRIQPHVKVIFSSGYDRNFMSGLENEVILCKPFYIEEMSRLIRKQLDS